MRFWVCRAGTKGCYIETFLEKELVSVPWQGYGLSWENMTKKDMLAEIMSVKHQEVYTTSVSNWLGQMQLFVNRMNIGDYVIVPDTKRGIYRIGIIESDYLFERSHGDEFKHYRKVQWLEKTLNKSELSQDFVYTLGAFRTVFEIKREEHIEQIMYCLEG